MQRPDAASSSAGMGESAVLFEGVQGPLVGILTIPSAAPSAAVLIVAGQPQTRVGAHRMFTELARSLAARGVASLRFDAGGWGDSPGEALAFERSEGDIAAAGRLLRDAVGPSASICIWGLCDGASAAVLALPALLAAGAAPTSMCLVNPWVRTDASLAQAMVKTYYARRLFDAAFWKRLLTGKIPMANLLEPIRYVIGRRPPRPAKESSDVAKDPPTGGPDLPTQLIARLNEFRGMVFTVLAGSDLTAGETDALMSRDKRWRKRLDRPASLLRVPGADHTFSDPAQWRTVCEWVATKAASR